MENEIRKEDDLVKYKNLSDNICIALTFYVFAFLLEIITSLCLFSSLPNYFYVSLLLIHIYAFIIFLLPTKTFRRVVACVLLVFQTLVSITNDILHNITGEVFTFDKLWLAGEAAGAFSFRMINFFHIILFLVVLAGALYCLFGLPKHIKAFRATKMQFRTIIVSILFTGFAVFGCVSTNYLEKRNLMITEYPTTLAYSTMGYHGFYLSNAFLTMRSLVFNKSLTEEQYNEYLTYLQAGNLPQTTEMTGVSEGNNVLVILAESLDMAAIDPYFTPNLYKMWFEDGMLLKNYHAENKTNMSEGMSLFGTYGREKPLISNVKLSEVYEYFSLPSVVKRQDSNTKTTFLHSFKSSYYSRDITHAKLGFDNVIFANKDEENIKKYEAQKGDNYSWSVQDVFNKYMKDSNFFDYNKEKIIPSSGKFFTSFSTMVTHGTYQKRGSNEENYETLISSENSSHFEDMVQLMASNGYVIPQDREAFLYYKAAVMDFDKMVGMIFDRLQSLNILDKTTIYMFPDHNTYYNDLSYQIRNIPKQDVRLCNVSAYNVGACIYDQKMIAKYKGESTYSSGVINEKFTSVNDLYPTLCDILNLKYNTNLCYGKSLFLDEDRVFISLKDDRYILNDKYYFFDNKVFDAKTREITSNEEFEKEVNEILYKFEVHEKLYKAKDDFIKIVKELGY